MTLSEITDTLAAIEAQADIIARELKGMSRLDVPDDSINLAFHALGGVWSAAHGARRHIHRALREMEMQG